MPYARWIEGVRTLVLAGLCAGGCGGDDAAPSGAAEVGVRGDAVEGGAEGGGGGDPLLRRAREGIREGALPEELRAEVLGSTAPEHARARRVLLAMAEPPGGADEGDGADGAGAREGDEGSRPPPILPPAGGEAMAEAGASAEGGRADDGRADGGERAQGGGRAQAGASSKPGGAERPSRPARARADVGGLAFKTTKNGATLTIAAPSSLVVGVANQPSSGIVRLVIESAQAGSAVLHARPRTEGAAVTGVRQGQGTVQVTIRLEPGWSLDSVQPFSGGARVHLVAPP